MQQATASTYWYARLVSISCVLCCLLPLAPLAAQEVPPEEDSLYIPPADTLNISAYIVHEDPAITDINQLNGISVINTQDVNEEGWMYGAYQLPTGGTRLFVITTDSTYRPDRLLLVADYPQVAPLGMSGRRIGYNRSANGVTAGFYRDYDEATGSYGPEQRAGRYPSSTTLTGIAGDYTSSNSLINPGRTDYFSLANLKPLYTFNIPFIGSINLFQYFVPDTFYRGFVKNEDSGKSRPLAFAWGQFYNRYSEANDVNSDGTVVGGSRGRQDGDVEVIYPFVYSYREDLGRSTIGYVLNGEEGYATLVNDREDIVGRMRSPANYNQEQGFFLASGCQNPLTEDFKFEIILPNTFITTEDLNNERMVIGSFLTRNTPGGRVENRPYLYQHCDCGEGDFYDLNAIFNQQYPAANWTLRVGRGLNDAGFAVGRGLDSLGRWINWRIRIPNCFLCVQNEQITWYQRKAWRIGQEAFNDPEITSQIRIADLTDPTLAEELWQGEELDSLIKTNRYYFKEDHTYEVTIDFLCAGVLKTRTIEVEVFDAHIPRATPNNVLAYGHLPAKAIGEFRIPGPQELEKPHLISPDEGYDLLIIQQQRAFSNFMVDVDKQGKEEVMAYYREQEYPLAAEEPELFSDLIVRELELWNQDHPDSAIRYQVMTDMNLMDSSYFFDWLEQYSAVWVNLEGMNEYGFGKYQAHAQGWLEFAATNTVIVTAGSMHRNYAAWSINLEEDFFLPGEQLRELDEQILYDGVVNPDDLLLDSVTFNEAIANQRLYLSPWQEYLQEAMEKEGLSSLAAAQDSLSNRVEQFYAYLQADAPVDKERFFSLFKASSLQIAGAQLYMQKKNALTPTVPSFDLDKVLLQKQYAPQDIDTGSVALTSLGYFAGLDGQTILALNGLLWGTANNLLYHKEATYAHAQILRNVVRQVAHITDTNFIVSPRRQFVYHVKDKPCFRTSLAREDTAEVLWYYRNRDSTSFTQIDPASFRFDPGRDWGYIEFMAEYQGRRDTIWGNIANWGLMTLTADGKKHIFDSEAPDQMLPGVQADSGQVLVVVHGWQPGGVAQRPVTLTEAGPNMEQAGPGNELLVKKWIEEGYTVLELNWLQIADMLNVQDVEQKIRERNEDTKKYEVTWRHEMPDLGDGLFSIPGFSDYVDELALDETLASFFARELKAFMEVHFNNKPLREFRMLGHSLGAPVAMDVMGLLLSEPPSIDAVRYGLESLQSTCVEKRIDMADAYWSVDYSVDAEEVITFLTDDWNVAMSNYKTTVARETAQFAGNACVLLFGTRASTFTGCAQSVLESLLRSAFDQVLKRRILTKKTVLLAGKKVPLLNIIALVIDVALQIYEITARINQVWNNVLAEQAYLDRVAEVSLDLRWFGEILPGLTNPALAHGAAWVHVLYNLKESEPGAQDPLGEPVVAFNAFNASTCPGMIRRYQGVRELRQIDNAGVHTLTTADDTIRFEEVASYERFITQQWQGYACGTEEVVRVELDDVLTYPAPLDTLFNEAFAFAINEADYSPGSVVISYGRENKAYPGKVKWFAVKDRERFWFDYTYYGDWSLEENPDSLFVPYGSWLIRANYACEVEGLEGEQIFQVETIDQGLYFKGPEGKLERFVAGEDNSYFEAGKSTLIYTHGYLGGAVKKRYHDDLNLDDRRLDENFQALDWNVGIYQWAQYADDEDFASVEAKLYDTYPNGLTFRTYDTDLVRNSNLRQGQNLTDLFEEALFEAIGTYDDWQTNELRLAGHGLGAQLVTLAAQKYRGSNPQRIAYLEPLWTASRATALLEGVEELYGMLDLENDEFDPDNKSYTAFEWYTATDYDTIGDPADPDAEKLFPNREIKSHIAQLYLTPDFYANDLGYANTRVNLQDWFEPKYQYDEEASYNAVVPWYLTSYGNEVPDEYLHDEYIENLIGYDNLYLGPEDSPYYELVEFEGKHYELEEYSGLSANVCTDQVRDQSGIIYQQLDGGENLAIDDDIHELINWIPPTTAWDEFIEQFLND